MRFLFDTFLINFQQARTLKINLLRSAIQIISLMSRRNKKKRSANVNDQRTPAEIEIDEVAAIDERRKDCDEASSMNLSSLLFSHKKIYLQPTQVCTKSDGTLGFYTNFDHFPDTDVILVPEEIPDPESKDNTEEKKTADVKKIPEQVQQEQMIGFVRGRTLFNPIATCLRNEKRVLEEKIDELDTKFQTIKVELDFNAEEMTESEKVEFSFKMRDLTRQLAVERSSVDALKEQLENEEEKGIAIVYSTADTEGRVITEEDVLDGYVPPGIGELEDEEKKIEEYRQEEERIMNFQLSNSCTSSVELRKDLNIIVDMKTEIGKRLAKAEFRKSARWLETF